MDKSLKYPRISFRQFAIGINSEQKARNLAWKMKFPEGFKCSKCSSVKYWELKSRPEVRECSACYSQISLRKDTIFESSKLPILTWMQAIYFVMQDKRGMSALSLMRLLGLSRYETAWTLLMRIRRALMTRDEGYKLKGTVQLDGAFYGHVKNEDGLIPTVIIGVESKDWVDAKGKPKAKAGFAKVLVDQFGEETKRTAQTFSKLSLEQSARLQTDGKKMYQKLGRRHEETRDLKWVNRFISNSKAWILGTHHGLKAPHKYLKYYLAEYSYRFNRRHDPNSLFHRALFASLNTKHVTIPALTGYA
jgi:hypothetical protein